VEDPHFKGTRDRNVRRWERGDSAERTETLAVEEPLEIRLGGRRFTLTMRTPGNDEELVAGFLFAEGFIENSAEIDEIRRVPGGDGMPEDNIVDVILRVPVDSLRERLRRNFAMTSSCGLCGKTSIESIARRIPPPVDAASIAASTLAGFAQSLAPAQPLFARTGGVHAAALFDLAGQMMAIREDVGRHNAMDKVIGWALARDLVPLRNAVVIVSGRLSFEIVQKAAVAAVPIVAAVSAPSSLAVELAEEAGTTLVGFVRDRSFNIYTHPQRILPR
jgi:FdhD protein